MGTTSPTVKGWYWARRRGDHGAQVVEVYDLGDPSRLYVGSTLMDWSLQVEDFDLWSTEPLVEPQLPGSPA